MALRLSKGARNQILMLGGVKDTFQGGKILVYTGAQPATAEAAPTGTLLYTLTDAGGAHTAEVRATGTVTLDSGASGSVDGVEVEGIEVLGQVIAYDSSLTITAAAVAAAINANPLNQLVRASSVGPAITLTMRKGWGAGANGLTVVSASTTIATTDVNIGSGVAGVSSVNGLRFGDAAAARLVKDPAQAWQGTSVDEGVAGWFRLVGPIADSGALDSSEAQVRMDGAIATAGSQMNLTATTIADAAVQTLANFGVTIPTL